MCVCVCVCMSEARLIVWWDGYILYGSKVCLCAVIDCDIALEILVNREKGRDRKRVIA